MRNRAVLVPLVLISFALGGTGCGTPPWQEPGATPSSAATRSATPTAAPVTTATKARPAAPTTTVPNDLATGSAKRRLEAGGVRMTINYWSTLPLDEWTGAAAKPLNLSASAKFIEGYEQNIFLSKVSVIVEVQGPKGPLAGPKTLVDKATLNPGYLIKSPNSYGQVFTIPALAPRATSVTLALTYELLAQTAPKAKTYAKQTASDSLTIPIRG